MKRIKQALKRALYVALGVGIVGGGLYWYFANQGTTYVAPKIERVEVEKEVEVPTLEKRINDALEANMSDIEATAQQAYDAAYTQAVKEVELEVISEYRAEIESRETELEKEVGVF